MNEARLNAIPMKIGAKALAPPPNACILSVQLDGSLMSNIPKSESASNTISRKRKRFSQRLVARACSAGPTMSPITVNATMIPAQNRTARTTAEARLPSCLVKNATVSGMSG